MQTFHSSYKELDFFLCKILTYLIDKDSVINCFECTFYWLGAHVLGGINLDKAHKVIAFSCGNPPNLQQ